MRMFCDAPLVSVLMGVKYTREDLFFLKRSVESILNQNYTNLEFLICENGSTPEAKQYLVYIAGIDSRVKLVSGDGADTLAAKLNRCIDMASGEYFARQDDDDVSDPNRLELQIAYLKNHHEVDFVGSIVRLEQDMEIVGVRELPEFPTVKDFLFVQPFLHPTLVFRRAVFQEGVRYCEQECCAYCEDYDLLLRLYETGKSGANIQTICFTYTIPPQESKRISWYIRFNEVHVRWVRFRSLKLLPGALPYVAKPLLVGLLPVMLLQKLKEFRRCVK